MPNSKLCDRAPKSRFRIHPNRRLKTSIGSCGSCWRRASQRRRPRKAASGLVQSWTRRSSSHRLRFHPEACHTSNAASPARKNEFDNPELDRLGLELVHDFRSLSELFLDFLEILDHCSTYDTELDPITLDVTKPYIRTALDISSQPFRHTQVVKDVGAHVLPPSLSNEKILLP